MSDTSRSISGLSEGLQLAALSAAAYLVAFLYEKGYCDHFGIPSTIIEPSVNNILIAAVGVATAFCFLLPLVELVTRFVVHLERYESLRPWRRIIFFNVFTAFICALALIFFGPNRWVLILSCAQFLGINVMQIGAASWRYRQLPSWRERFIAADENDYAPIMDGPLYSLLGLGRMTVVFGVIVGGAMTYGVGRSRATWETSFFFLDSSPNYVVLRNYRDVLIAAPLGETRNSVENRLMILRISDSERVDLTRKFTGPLKRAELERGEKTPQRTTE